MEFDVESPAYAAIRWLVFSGLLGLIGVAAFQHVTLRFVRGVPDVVRPAMHRATTVGLAASVLLLVATLGQLVAQLYTLSDPGAGIDLATVTTLLLHTVWGWGWLMQLAATLFAAYCYHPARRTERCVRGAAIAIVILGFTPALAGHAVAAGRFTPLAVTAAGFHVLGAGAWLGTLGVLLLAGLPAAGQLAPAQRGPATAALVNAFSPTALVGAGLVVGTGVFTTWLHVGTVSGLWQSRYGRLVLIKLSVFGLIAAMGAYHWRLARPTLGKDGTIERFRWSAMMEMVAAAVIVAITAVLAATPAPVEFLQ